MVGWVGGWVGGTKICQKKNWPKEGAPEPSSSFVQRHEFNRCFHAAIFFQLRNQTPCRREAQDRRRACERESISHVGFGKYHTAWGNADWVGILISARQKRKLSVKFSSVAQR